MVVRLIAVAACLAAGVSAVAQDAAPDEDVIPPAAAEGGPQVWEVVASELNLRAAPSTGAEILDRLANGTLLSNLGCEAVGGRVWCDVQRIEGGPRGLAAFAYLRPALGADGQVAFGPDRSAVRAGRGEFDARGRISCAIGVDAPMDQCDFAVARGRGGNATLVLDRPDGGERVFFFVYGRPIGVMSSEADPAGDFVAVKDGDLHRIRVGEERYEIPDAAVVGG